MRALALISGGLDSAVAAYVAKQEVQTLYGLNLSYGQRHGRECEAAEEVAVALGLVHLYTAKVRLPSAYHAATSLLAGSHLRPPVTGVAPGIPHTWIPQRNTIFLAIAAGLAETLGCAAIYGGFNAVDYSGYPDCRPEFMAVMKEALNMASKRYIEAKVGLDIRTPLINLTKAEIIQLGQQLGVPFEKTWSCYYGGQEAACGGCDSCRIRLAGFRAAGLKDPLQYVDF